MMSYQMLDAYLLILPAVISFGLGMYVCYRKTRAECTQAFDIGLMHGRGQVRANDLIQRAVRDAVDRVFDGRD